MIETWQFFSYVILNVCKQLCLILGNCYFTRCYFMCVYIYIYIYTLYLQLTNQYYLNTWCWILHKIYAVIKKWNENFSRQLIMLLPKHS